MGSKSEFKKIMTAAKVLIPSWGDRLIPLKVPVVEGYYGDNQDKEL